MVKKLKISAIIAAGVAIAYVGATMVEGIVGIATTQKQTPANYFRLNGE